MNYDGIQVQVINEKAPLPASRELPLERLPAGTTESAAVQRALSVSTLVEQCQRHIQAYRRGDPSDEVYGLELLHRAIVQGDQVAWAGVQQCLGEIVRG